MFKKTVAILLVVIVVLGVILSAIIHEGAKVFDERDDAQLEEVAQPLKKLEEVLDSGDLDGLTLTIYYSSPLGDHEPMSVNGLIEYINMYGDNTDDSIYRIDVESDELKNHLSVLKSLCDDQVHLKGSEEFMDVRIYYELRLNKEVLLKVSLWSVILQLSYNGINSRYIVINDTEINTQSTAYYDIIMPFLRDKDANELKQYIEGEIM